MNERFTADQAFAHPWIQNQEQLKNEPLNEETYAEMKSTLNHAKVQKVVLLYMSQNTPEKNMKKLQEAFDAIDPEKKGQASYDQFRQAMQEAGMPCLPREFDELMKELDPSDPPKGTVPYQVFLDQVYISKMYL